MKCSECGLINFDKATRCLQCGASLAAGEDSLKSDLSSSVSIAAARESKHIDRTGGLGLEVDLLDEGNPERKEGGDEEQWGGFFRRTCASSVDLIALSLLSSLLFYLGYVGYKVGLTAHHQSLSWDNLVLFLYLFLIAWIALVSGYFILLHGMGGKTIGKWLLGLRVVGVGRAPISYSKALLRWLGTIVCAVFGTGFLWILCNKEKRGWHDLLARTWVIRERAPQRIMK
jgi:uncharacterized RDD family membrane protein YckC